MWLRSIKCLTAYRSLSLSKNVHGPFQEMARAWMDFKCVRRWTNAKRTFSVSPCGRDGASYSRNFSFKISFKLTLHFSTNNTHHVFACPVRCVLCRNPRRFFLFVLFTICLLKLYYQSSTTIIERVGAYYHEPLKRVGGGVMPTEKWGRSVNFSSA